MRPRRLPTVLAAVGLAGIVAGTGSFLALRDGNRGTSAIASAAPTIAVRATQPGPLRYPVTTAAEVLAGVATDPFVTGNSPNWDAKSLGTPVFVRALRPTDQDLWLVPENSEGTKTFRIVVVNVARDGLGAAGMKAGGLTADPAAPSIAVPPLSEERAWQLAATVLPDRGTAELVWMFVSPSSGFFVEEIRPMWRLSSRTGSVEYVTSDGQLVNAAKVDALR
jgi:hypothetical protein